MINSYKWCSYYSYDTNGTTSSASEYELILYNVTINMIFNYHKWIFSIIGCILVGLAGILPLFIFPVSTLFPEISTTTENGVNKEIPSHDIADDKNEPGIDQKNLKRLLSFAVGSLLGDVFLHLLPEAWHISRHADASSHETLACLGKLVLAGVVSFHLCEALATSSAKINEEDIDMDDISDSSSSSDSQNNNADREKKLALKAAQKASRKKIAGYLNLVANSFDNFTHGLAVAASFLVSTQMGFLTTLAILLHEIPHEVGDFAILLRSGFKPWEAAKAQLSTASIGLLGAIVTLSVDSTKTMGDLTYWILPFTSGCFINIALSNLLPDLMKEEDPKESCLQFLSLIFGIILMGLVSICGV